MDLHRLFWNFEYHSAHQLPDLFTFPENENKAAWEVRYFWPANQIISLQALPTHIFELSRYKIKHQSDKYILIPHKNYNIKIRKKKLLYKPILQSHQGVYQFGKKQQLDEAASEQLGLNIQTHQHLLVLKETLLYPLTNSASSRLEFTRLNINQTIFFSFAIQSPEYEPIELLLKNIQPSGSPMPYVTFLQQNMAS